jgi:hypothetical protein
MWENRVQGRVLVGRPDGETPLKDVDVDGRIILKLVFKQYGGGNMNRIDLAEDRDSWQSDVNTAMNIHRP